MRLLFFCHWNLVFILPCLSHQEARCSNPECNVVHGWAIELGFAWFSLVLEGGFPRGQEQEV